MGVATTSGRGFQFPEKWTENPGYTPDLPLFIHGDCMCIIIRLSFPGPTDFIFTSILPITVAASPASTEDPPTERRQCVNVFIINDMISEETESFTLELSFTDTEVDLDPQITEIFIVDDDGTIIIMIKVELPIKDIRNEGHLSIIII